MKKRIRTRYAPSPTGYLHIGGARTALFNYLFAKHSGGDFVLRIEDTDKTRNVEHGEESQIENLEWLGIIPDESPAKPITKYGHYRQSEKLARYNTLVEKLIADGKAYKSFDTPLELETQRAKQRSKGQFSFRYDKNWLAKTIDDTEIQKRNKEGLYSIRISLKQNYTYSWNDIVRGKIDIKTEEIGDWVIRKSDGVPTYNFAVVVDDYDMKISHVLRGEEHISNTAKQLAIYDAFNWEAPTFGHLTLITNFAGKKLSKRDDVIKQFIADYRKEGFVPHAIFNFLSLLGWTHPDAKENLTKEELIDSFDLERLSKSPSKFDIKKMEWFSKHYIQLVDKKELIKKLESKNDLKWMDLFLEIYLPSVISFKALAKAFALYSQEYFRKPILSVDDKKIVKHFLLNLNQNEFSIDLIQKAINETKKTLGIRGKKLFLPIRLATTFQKSGPELAKAIYLFGQSKIMKRLLDEDYI